MLFNNLETERLLLHNIDISDREFIFSQFSDDVVNRYLFDAEPLGDISEADELINFYTIPEPRLQHRWLLEGNQIIEKWVLVDFIVGIPKMVRLILKEIYDDYVVIRRYLVDYGFMERTNDCKEYWLK